TCPRDRRSAPARAATPRSPREWACRHRCRAGEVCSERRCPDSFLEVGELVLADLELVTVEQLVGLDPAPVHVRAVQRAEVVDVEAVTPLHQQRVIARDRDIVKEYLSFGATA